MQTKKKRQFSVSLDVDIYFALNCTDTQNLLLSLLYFVSYALNEFIDTHLNKQVEFNFEWRTG